MPGDPTPGSLAQKDATTLGNMICRDYLRGVCYRAENCKFLHSEQHAPVTSNQLPVCRDYQNGTCNRRNCKYAHIYSSSGFYDPVTMTAVPQGGVPRNAQNNNYSKNVSARHPPPPAVMPDQPPSSHYEEVFKTRAGPNDPLCKDFQNGYCQRGQNCRFKHISYIPEQPMYHGDPNVVPAMPMEPRHYPYSAVNGSAQPMMYPADPHAQNFSAMNNSINAPPMPNTNYTAVIPTKRPYLATGAGGSTIDPSNPNSSMPCSKLESNDHIHEIEMLRSENARLHEELNARCVEIESLKNELSRYQYKSHGGDAPSDKTKPPPNSNNMYAHHKTSPHSQKSPSKSMYNQGGYPPNPSHYNK